MALHKNQLEIVGVWGRSLNNAQKLAERVDCQGYNDLSKLQTIPADLIVLAVNDANIAKVAGYLTDIQVPIVHTSGATSMEVLKHHQYHYGIFYPLQTFTKTKLIDFNTLPIIIDANSTEFQQQLFDLAKQLTEKVHSINNEDRQFLHLAAVMLNNNINHLLTKVEEILANRNLPKSILQPLLNETIQKASFQSPAKNQTGPAKRDDNSTKSIHLQLIETLEDAHLKQIYLAFWESISAYYK